jgi:NAD(P)-dependent dehydrogenase (short-subunit alcohol dehydrogenase family)
MPIDPELLGLEDAVALVTGGAQSIGRGCAVQLARAGCHIAIVDIADASDAVAEIEGLGLGRRALFVQADLRSKSSVDPAVGRVVSAFGRLDVAVNTVGGTSAPKALLDMTADEWASVALLNEITTLLCLQAEALSMISAGTAGSIINIASVSGAVGAPNTAGYGAANAGVISLTKSAALELAAYGVRVNCIVPGAHWTETTRQASAPGADPGLVAWVEAASKAAPLGRLGEVSEAGGVAVFLASKLSSYITGHPIACDGGILHTTSRPPIGMTMVPAALAGMVGDRRISREAG